MFYYDVWSAVMGVLLELMSGFNNQFLSDSGFISKYSVQKYVELKNVELKNVCMYLQDCNMY